MTLTLTNQIWQTTEVSFPKDGTPRERLVFLLRYAAMAPSSHNSQPWRFSVSDNEITISPATDRWLKEADPDQRELYVSIGCALENLLVAAEHFGYRSETELSDTDEGDTTVTVRLTPASESLKADEQDEKLFAAIPLRRTYHKPFGPVPLDDKHRRALRNSLDIDDVHLFFLEGATGPKKSFGRTVLKADQEQFADPAYRNELAEWIGAGAFGDGKIRAKIAKWTVRHRNVGDSQAQKDHDLVGSAPAVGILAGDATGHEAHIHCGQAFERLALLGLTLGIGVHPLSPPLELEDRQKEVQSLIPSKSMTVQHVFRLGYPMEEEEHTPRLPVEELLV